MREVIYKQWYFSQHKYETASSNVEHLKYIAFREHAITNKGCGHCLWGKLSGMREADNIDNMRKAIYEVGDASKAHTIYRTVISLEESVAKEKGYDNREAWQELIDRNVKVIAKENDIELKDFRWCASYHHKRGNPHVHLLFWDNSDRIRDEFVAEQRFAIAVEHIRAKFNGDIFREELQVLREEQKEEKKEIREIGRNLVRGFSGLRFFDDETLAKEEEGRITPNCYPGEISQEVAAEVMGAMERLLHALPATGQLGYQYLSPQVKSMIDEISELLIKHTSMNAPHARYLDMVAQIAQTYGNRGEQIIYEMNKAHRKVLKNMGNDVLKAIKEQGLLEQISDDRRRELKEIAGEAAIDAADRAVEEKMKDAAFQKELREIARLMPKRFAPMGVVLQDERISERLRTLTLECCNSGEVKHRTKVSQAIWDAVGSDLSKQPVPEALEEQPIKSELEPLSLFLNAEDTMQHFIELGKNYAMPKMTYSETLEQLESQSPVRVAYRKDYYTDGAYEPESGEIYIRSNLAPEDQVVALAREMANARYYQKWASTNETISNCAAIAQCARMGLDVDWLDLENLQELATDKNVAEFVYQEIINASAMDSDHDRISYYKSPAMMLRNPERLTDYLVSRGGLHQYSDKNYHKILSQCPGAQMVLDEKQWGRLGREIKGNATPIIISKAIPLSGGGVEFEERAVYDIADTEGDAVDRMLEKSPRQLRNILTGLEAASPVSVRYTEDVAGESYYDPDKKEIQICAGLDDEERIYTLAKEAAHARQHLENGAEWERVDILAQCAAVKTCAYYGLTAPQPDRDTLINLLENAPFNKVEFAKMFVAHVESLAGKYKPINLNAPNEAGKEKREKRENQAFKAVYRYLFKKIYEQAAEEKGWHKQRQMATFVHFLMDFARITKQSNHNYKSNLLIAKRDLSKQAKRELAKKLENSNQMWDS